MKKILCIAMCLILCGCSVRKLESAPAQVFASDVTIKLALFDNVPSELEKQADQYRNTHPSVHFEFLRHPNDASWRSWLTEQLNTQKITGFSVGSHTDIQFFASSEAELPRALSEKAMDSKAFPFFSYLCGIWYNEQILSALGISPSELQTMPGLTSAIQTLKQRASELNLTQPVCSQTDLTAIASTCALKKGVPNESLQTLLSLAGKEQAQDPAKCLIDHQCALYFGSSRKLFSAFSTGSSLTLQAAPIPYAQSAALIADQDFMCVCSDASEPEQKALADFLSRLSSEVRSPSPSQNPTASASKNNPPGWENEFLQASEMLRLNQIGWEDFANRMLSAWQKGSKLEVIASS